MSFRLPSGFWGAALVASVLVNGVMLGVIAAGAASGLRLSRGEPPEIVEPVSMRMLRGGVPPEARQEMERRFQEQARESRALMEAARNADQAVLDALTAEEFDPEAARAAFAETRQARDALEARAHELLITLFSNMSHEARVEMVERRGRWDGPDNDRFRGDGRFGDDRFGDGRFGDGRFGDRGPGGPPPPDGPPPGPPPGD